MRAVGSITGVTELFVPTGGSGSEGRSTVEPHVASGERSKVEVKLTAARRPRPPRCRVRQDRRRRTRATRARGAKRTLTQQHPVVLIEIEQRGDTDVREVIDHLVDHGYQGWFRYDRRWNPIDQFDIEKHQLRAQAEGRAARLYRQLAPRHVEVRQQVPVLARRVTSAAKRRDEPTEGFADGSRRRGEFGREDAARLGGAGRLRPDVLLHRPRGNGTGHSREFYAGGPELVARFVDPGLKRWEWTLPRRVLEIGCGMGRLFEGLSARFGEVWGIDISETMIAKGRGIVRFRRRGSWVTGARSRGRRQQRGPRDLLRGLPTHPRA